MKDFYLFVWDLVFVIENLVMNFLFVFQINKEKN